MASPYLYWQKAPLGWRDAPAVVALAAQIRKRDPRLLLLDLWDWAKVHGEAHPLATAADAMERGAGWRGKRGVFYQGLVAAGWVREVDGTATILDWEADGIVRGRPTLAGVVPEGEEILDADEARKIKARVRKQKSRDKENHVTPESVTERDASVTCHSGSVTERDASVTGIFSTPPNRAESPVYAGIVTPKSKREEEDKDKDSEKNLALFAPQKVAEAPKRRGRPPKDQSPEAEAERLAEKADGERWITAARALIGLTDEEAPWSSATFMAFRRARKQRGVEQLMRALAGLEGDRWASSLGLAALLSAAVIEKGLAAGNRRANVVGTGFDAAWDNYAKEAGLV